LGAYLAVLKNDINLQKEEGKKTFIYMFSEWMWDSAVNVKNVIGYAVKLDWMPKDDTASTKRADTKSNATKKK